VEFGSKNRSLALAYEMFPQRLLEASGKLPKASGKLPKASGKLPEVSLAGKLLQASASFRRLLGSKEKVGKGRNGSVVFYLVCPTEQKT